MTIKLKYKVIINDNTNNNLIKFFNIFQFLQINLSICKSIFISSKIQFVFSINLKISLFPYNFRCFLHCFCKPISNLGNVRYNQETDAIEVNFNGKWIKCMSANVQTYYLYNQGDEITHITGGWTVDGYTMANYTLSQGSLNEANMSFSGVGSGKGQFFGTYYPIDLTGYKKLCIHVVDATTSTSIVLAGQLSIGTSKSTNASNPMATITHAGEGTYELDVTNYNGKYYVFVYSNNSANRSMIVDKVWLE